ncbi:acyl-CoA thioesterase [Parvicella tangerina]|uniref:Acyl-CoA thioesterase n=1 Tax=Parvicella tangerina TaxID=2829795 RepID=A0A916JQM5_9FLAO|nr:thioesterase family protein [Parvicella tangerina]CAG5087491.1 hypothetical protein CRYO30217_03496 [Parvicella tangerina]
MDIDLSTFKFSFPIQMRWSDMDPLGHANNGIYVTYFEIARGKYMIEACPNWNWEKDMFLIASVTVDFHRELLLTAEDAKVHIRTSDIGNKSFVLDYVITSVKNGETIIHASGNTTQIMFDMKSRKTIKIPNWVRASLIDFDNVVTDVS